MPGHYLDIFAGFEEGLFRALAPSFPPLQILRYDGNQPGDQVQLRLGWGPFGQNWTSVISSHECDPAAEECWFVDEGTVLPWPLQTWQHRHLVKAAGKTQSLIIEDIRFSTGSAVLDSLMKVAFQQQFSSRGPKYRAYFESKFSDTCGELK